MSQADSKISQRFATVQIVFLVYTVIVIAWGALVRATRSGAGCGDAWPLCQGRWIPISEHAATLIEFFHRLSSGLCWPWALLMWLWSWRAFERQHPARRAAGVVLLLMTFEALIGALLVQRGLVADNTSTHRALVLTLHLCNTLALLMAMTLTLWFALSRNLVAGWSSLPQSKGLGAILVSAVIVAATGALSALADTLFPPVSVVQSFYEDFLHNSHFLIRLRVLHPLFAILFFVLCIAGFAWLTRERPALAKFANALGALITLQLVLGLANIFLLVPLWLQLLHLVVADTLWIGLVWFSAETLRA